MRYLRIILLYSNDVFQQRARNIVWFLLSLIMPLVTLLFWQGAFATRRVIDGWTLEQMRSYYLVTVIAGSMLLAHVEMFVAYDQIKNGNIATILLRPVTYYWYVLTLELPWRIIQGTFGIITVLLFLLFGVHIQLATDFGHLFVGFLMAVSAFLLSYTLKMLVSMLAFWLTDIGAILEAQDVMILILAGIIMPVSLLPFMLPTISAFTPFPYIIYYPVLIMIGKVSPVEGASLLLVQWVWIGILFTLYTLLWKRGIYKFSGVGQ